MREYATLTGYPGDAAALVVRLPAVPSHAREPRRKCCEEAKTFREKKLPCDALIYLGTGFCPSGWNTDNGEFTFNRKVFPDPAAMIEQLHDDHFKVVLHVVLEGHHLTGHGRRSVHRAAAPERPHAPTASGPRIAR